MKSNQKLTILFWHRKSKADENGNAPIICRISIDGDEEEISLGKKVHQDNWDCVDKQARGGVEAKKTNSKIAEMTVDLERHFTILQSQFENVTPLMLKNVFRGLPPDHPRGKPKLQIPKAISLLQLVDQFITGFTELVKKKKRSDGTLKQWRSAREKIVEFLQRKYRLKDISLQEIDFSFATDCYKYLTLEREKLLSDASAKKQIKKIKQILTEAESLKLLNKNPIEKFRCGGDETDVPPLEFHEVNQIWRKNITITRLIEVRDDFIAQCFTGFAFQDLYALGEDNIVRVGVKGERWLIKERGKTGTTEMVPIMPIVEEIIAKYKDHPCRKIKGRLFPVDSNARYNGYLKEIGAITGLNRELNTHLARHTFADMMLNIFGFSLEEVSKMLGHKSIRTTQRYAKVRKHKISKTWSKVKTAGFTKNGQLRAVAV